jgi:hypothetical protein
LSGPLAPSRPHHLSQPKTTTTALFLFVSEVSERAATMSERSLGAPSAILPRVVHLFAWWVFRGRELITKVFGGDYSVFLAFLAYKLRDRGSHIRRVSLPRRRGSVRPSLEIKNLPFQKKRTYSFHTIRALFFVTANEILHKTRALARTILRVMA